MQDLAPSFLTALANQIGFLSAFLGGFAATFLGTLLSINSPKRQASWAIACSAGSSAAFVGAVLGATALAASLHPDAPPGTAEVFPVDRARIVMSLAFAAGAYLMLATLGLSGWVRSSRMGWVTTGIAVAAALVATWSAVGFT